MSATHTHQPNTTVAPKLYLALELGWNYWKLAFTVGLGQKPRLRTIPARDTELLLREIDKAKARFGLPDDVPVVSCYEAGRDGFWLHRLLVRSCINEARRLRRHRVDVELISIDVAAADDSMSSMADRDELDRGFSRLEPEARALIVMHHYLDLPLPEVALALGLPLGTAKSRLHRALGFMRAALDADARPGSELPVGRPA